MSANRLGFKHKKVQRLRRLLRQASMRESESVFVIEGSKLLAEAIASHAVIESIFVSGSAPSLVIDTAVAAGHRVHYLADGVMARVAETVTPQPVAAVVRMCDVELSAIANAATVAVLVDVRDPGNAGTILRSVEAAGSGAAIFCKGSVDVYNPKTVRSSAGSLFHLPFVRNIELYRTLGTLGEMGFAKLATTVGGGRPYDEFDLTGKIAVILGNEANGLSVDVELSVDMELVDMEERLDAMLSIPIEGRSESLNVSMAMTAIAFEAARQRRASK